MCDANDESSQNDSDSRRLRFRHTREYFDTVCANAHVEQIKSLLRHEIFDPADDVESPNSLDLACQCADVELFSLLIQDDRFVKPRMFEGYLKSALYHSDILRLLVQHPNCTASQKTFNLIIERAIEETLIPTRIKRPLFCYDIIDMVVNNTDFDMMQNDQLLVALDKIAMIRSRATNVCVGLQDLCLPALITLEILDALVPNNIRMAAKWDLIVAVKHFHQRKH